MLRFCRHFGCKHALASSFCFASLSPTTAPKGFIARKGVREYSHVPSALFPGWPVTGVDFPFTCLSALVLRKSARSYTLRYYCCTGVMLVLLLTPAFCQNWHSAFGTHGR